jgi:hypothetical protein
VTNAIGVETSAIALINGIAARIQAAVDAAISGGATKEDLAPVQTEVDSLNASAKALADAVAANPGPPVTGRK